MVPTGNGACNRRRTKAEINASAERPKALAVNPDGILAELKDRPQWVAWRYERRKGKWTKVPVNCRTGDYAKSTDSATWVGFTEALLYYRAKGLDGIGYVPLPEDRLAFCDLDECRDPLTGAVEPWAAAIVTELASYTEVTASATGLHVVCHGRKPDRKRSKKGRVEIYDGLKANGQPGGRFLACTGHKLDGTPAEICGRQEALEAVYGRELKDAGKPAPARQPQAAACGFDDQQLVEKARHAKNGEKFARLWSGDHAAYSSPSEADLALCSLLAFWCQGDADRIDRLFRQSGLMREKWDERRGDTTYGRQTIARVVEARTEFYNPRRRDRVSAEQPAVDVVAPDVNPQGQPEGDQGGLYAYDIILAHFKEEFRPRFRRGPVLYSETYGREVRAGEALMGAGIQLIAKLSHAVNAPRLGNGQLNMDKLPSLFNTWVRSAWKDLLDGLPEEEEADEISGLAREQFWADMAAVMNSIISIGYRYDRKDGGQELQDVQRRSLINLCQVWAQEGKWSAIRSYLLLTRKDRQGERTRLRIALRVGLFRQPGVLHTRLAALSQNKFSRLAGMYDVSTGEKDLRVKGDRVVELHPDFIDWLLLDPAKVDEMTNPGPHAHACARENVKSSESGSNGQKQGESA
jgi:hypothetical protein